MRDMPVHRGNGPPFLAEKRACLATGWRTKSSSKADVNSATHLVVRLQKRHKIIGRYPISRRTFPPRNTINRDGVGSHCITGGKLSACIPSIQYDAIRCAVMALWMGFADGR